MQTDSDEQRPQLFRGGGKRTETGAAPDQDNEEQGQRQRPDRTPRHNLKRRSAGMGRGVKQQRQQPP